MRRISMGTRDELLEAVAAAIEQQARDLGHLGMRALPGSLYDGHTLAGRWRC